MATESKVGQFFSNLGDKLREQQWFQQLQAKWDELDPQSRTYLKFAGTGISLVLTLVIMIGSVLHVRGLKNEVNEKQELIQLIENANDELRRLRENGSKGGLGSGDTPGWPPYFDTTAANAGVPKESLTISDEKEGKSTEQAKESLFELNLKRVNIKQVSRFAFFLENGTRPIKLRNLTIDTKSDPSGYMDATLAISAFSLKQ